MPKEGLEVKKKYTYNSEDDIYVIEMKHRVTPLVLHGYKVRAIRRAITNSISPSETSAQVCTKYNLLPDDVEALKKAFDLTRDAFPLTDEEVEGNSVEQNTTTILDEKRSLIAQAVEKEEWKETLADAKLWRGFVAKQHDPFSSALDGWTPPEVKPISKPTFKKAELSDEVLVIGLSDLHYGASSNSRYMFNRPDWSTKKTVESVRKFATELIKHAANRKTEFKKIIILGLGDLIHSLNGKTSRGTELIFDCVREEQFQYAMDSLYEFIGLVRGIAPEVEVHSVYGNHNYETEMALFRALEKSFNKESSIKFFHYSSRPAAFKEGTTLFLLDHGADSIERAYVPTTESKLQSHVQSLLLQAPELLLGTKERLFCMGDKHHWEHIEYSDFQFLMFGTILGGDQHASVNNLRNRPRQSYLILDAEGLKSVGHVYFD